MSIEVAWESGPVSRGAARLKVDAVAQYAALQRDRNLARAATVAGLFGINAALVLMVAGEQKNARALLSVSAVNLAGARCIFAGTKRRASLLLGHLRRTEQTAQ